LEITLAKKKTQFLDVNFNYQGKENRSSQPFIPESTIKSLFLIRT
jgi:hypothetical protein